MELKPNQNATSKSNNSETKFTNFNQPNPKYDTEDQYEEIILKPSNIHDNANEENRNNTSTNILAVSSPTPQTADPWWRKRTNKWLLSGVILGACVCLIVLIAVAIVWIRKPQTPHTSQTGDTKTEHDNSQDSLITQRVRHDRFIGFTAWAPATIGYASEDVIRFTEVLLNEGGLYSKSKGTFSCDIGGVYYVSVTLKRTVDVLMIRVYKGEKDILTVQDYSSRNPGISITISRLVICNPGEHLFIRSFRFGKGDVYGEARARHSTFTVFLIQETTGVRSNKFVGFSAAKNPHQLYFRGTTITFSKVLYNDGGHFRPDTNRFVCPVSGVYYVSVAFLNLKERMSVCVSKSSQQFLHSADSDKNEKWFKSSNTALIRCQQNETITVEGTGRGRLEGYKQEVSTFNVILLHYEVGNGKSAFIGFSMYKKTTQAYSSSQIISFDGEIMNKGNYFQLERNHFNCPVNAVYYISINAKKDGTSPLNMDVLVEADTVIRVESTETENCDSVISNSALVKCQAGQVVSVQGAGTGSVFGHRSEKHTTFTVFMVHQY